MRHRLPAPRARPPTPAGGFPGPGDTPQFCSAAGPVRGVSAPHTQGLPFCALPGRPSPRTTGRGFGEQKLTLTVLEGRLRTKSSRLIFWHVEVGLCQHRLHCLCSFVRGQWTRHMGSVSGQCPSFAKPWRQVHTRLQVGQRQPSAWAPSHHAPWLAHVFHPPQTLPPS